MRKGKLRVLHCVFCTIAYGGLFAPIIALLVANWDIYFIKNESAFSVSMGGIFTMITIVLMIKKGFKGVNPIFWSLLLFLICFCLDSIIKDLVVITFCVLIGVSWFTIFKLPMKHYKRLLTSYTDESVRTVARQETQDKLFGGRC